MKNCGQNDNVEYQVFDASGKSLKLVKDRDGRWNVKSVGGQINHMMLSALRIRQQP